jgi:class 3 adenylate cyclase
MTTARVERRLAAILAADVVGYSRPMGEDEAGTLSRLKAHRKELIEPLLAEHRGRIVKLMGDGVLCEFPSVVDAVACAVAIQQSMAGRERGVPEAERIRFRIGVNLGDIIVEGEDIYGDGVNVAARLEGLAEPGGVCVSGKVREGMRKRLDLAFAPMGAQRVKNIAEPVETWRVLLDGHAPPARRWLRTPGRVRAAIAVALALPCSSSRPRSPVPGGGLGAGTAWPGPAVRRCPIDPRSRCCRSRRPARMRRSSAWRTASPST